MPRVEQLPTDPAMTHSPVVAAEGADHAGPSAAPPFSLVVGIACGLLGLLISRSLLRDGDLYWHILAGEELASGTAPSSLGLGWSFATDFAPWVSTQWLSELLFYFLHEVGGWSSFALFRVATAMAALAVLARTTLAGRPTALAAFPFLFAAGTVALVSQERPQQFTLIGAAFLGGVLFSSLRPGVLPPWWALAALTVVWANLHGGWVLVPAVLFLIALGRFADNGIHDSLARRALALWLLTIAAGLITPAGIAGLTAPLRFRAATDNLVEWGPTIPATAAGAVSLIMLALAMIGWARSPRVPRSEILVVLVLLVFALSAWRNLAPALVLLAPLIAERMTLAFPGVGRRAEPPWSRRAGILLAGLLTLIGIATIPGQSHLPSDTNPVRLAQQISNLPQQQRVLNDYNVAGLVLYFGGPETQVAIDGRADRYGSQYIQDYLKLSNLQGDWQSLLAQLAPTSALIERDTALAFYLVDVRGWQVVDEDDEFVLLEVSSQE